MLGCLKIESALSCLDKLKNVINLKLFVISQSFGRSWCEEFFEVTSLITAGLSWNFYFKWVI